MSRRVVLSSTLLLLPLAIAPGCIPSNVVARDDRMVTTALEDLRFEPAGELALDGLWSSVAISGDAALSLRKVYYVFLPGGAYTAAALVDDGSAPAFQTLTGTFAVSAAGIVFDGAEPVPLEVAPGYLRITAPTGALVLRRETGQ